MTVRSDVVTFVAEQGGLGPENLAISSRLFHDLGFDGDDAVELFEQFGQQFDVDLAPLYENWARHFGPEGYGDPKACLLGIGLLGIVPAIVLMFVGISPMWGWSVAIVGVLGWVLFRRIRPVADDTIPITIQDLVRAAETKHWPLSYSS